VNLKVSRTETQAAALLSFSLSMFLFILNPQCTSTPVEVLCIKTFRNGPQLSGRWNLTSSAV